MSGEGWEGEVRGREDTPRGLVLVVDDDEGLLHIIGKLLGEARYRVFFARDGAAALRQLDAAPVDVVLLDILLGGGDDGWEVCRRIKARPGAPKVALMTGVPEEGSYERALAAGADDLLLKPFQRSELLLRLQSLVRMRRLEAAQAAPPDALPPGPLRDADAIARAELRAQAIFRLLAHETCGALGITGMNAEWLLEHGLAGADQRDAAQSILTASATLRRTLANLLDLLTRGTALARAHAGLDLHEVIRHAVAQVAPRAATRRVTLAAPSPPVPVRLDANADILGRLLVTMIDVSLRRSRPGTRLDFESTIVEPGTLELRLSDESEPLPAPWRARPIDDALLQVAGLGTAFELSGLCFCHMAAAAHGGSFRVALREPRGNVYLATLPVSH